MLGFFVVGLLAPDRFVFLSPLSREMCLMMMLSSSLLVVLYCTVLLLLVLPSLRYVSVLPVVVGAVVCCR